MGVDKNLIHEPDDRRVARVVVYAVEGHFLQVHAIVVWERISSIVSAADAIVLLYRIADVRGYCEGKRHRRTKNELELVEHTDALGRGRRDQKAPVARTERDDIVVRCDSGRQRGKHLGSDLALVGPDETGSHASQHTRRWPWRSEATRPQAPRQSVRPRKAGVQKPR